TLDQMWAGLPLALQRHIWPKPICFRKNGNWHQVKRRKSLIPGSISCCLVLGMLPGTRTLQNPYLKCNQLGALRVGRMKMKEIQSVYGLVLRVLVVGAFIMVHRICMTPLRLVIREKDRKSVV